MKTGFIRNFLNQTMKGIFMTITTLVKPTIFIAGLLSMAVIFSRCTSPSSGSGSAATTFAISGNMSIGQTATSLSVQSTGVGLPAIMAGDVNALATQCSDGYYYTVYCVSYSEPPTAATGAVTCTGNSGAFTVAGLPLNAEIGCFVRRSADNTTYATLGTIEIPTTSLSGGTTTLVSQGDLNLSIDLNTDGSITTTVTGGGDNVVTPVDSGTDIDVSQYNGFWSIQCDPSATGDLVNPVRCLCQNGGQELTPYQPGQSKNLTSINPEDACIADNGAEATVADTQEFVEINMYKATPATQLTIDDGIVIPAGTQIPVISVWGASSGSSSSRGGGGEQAAGSVKDKNNATVNLTWSSTQATDPILWSTSGTVSGTNGVDLDLSGSATPLNAAFSNPTAANWKAWVKYLYDQSIGFTCTWGVAINGSNDAGCLSEFADRQLGDNRELRLPIVRIHRKCDQNGCDADVTHAVVNVDGYRVDYNGVLPANIDAVVLQAEGVSPELRARYVFEPFEATPTGGGFTQHHYNNRGYMCDDAPGQQVQDAACDGADHNFLHCGFREELSIKFKPTSTTAMKLFFEQRSSVAYATLEKWTTGIKTNGSFADALRLCEAESAGSEARFQMTAAKQP
jgi:hypothetical protein